MEVDMSEKNPDWAAMWLAESITLAVELAHEGLIDFEDEPVTLNHSNFKKNLRSISLQCIGVEGKNLI